jgi:ubiquinone/menaquinone biosynthesis C-methylase UbiE
MAKGGADDVPDIAAGFTRVDAQPDTSVLVAGMDATARWPAVKQLRAWERTHLALGPGDRLLDVGCGPGDVAVELAADVGPAGSVLGVDASEAMISVARRRAAAAGARVEFRVADAQSLPVADGQMDACRSERMLQWVPDTDRAAGELVRILRPGGRLVVTDTDWRSLAFDASDAQDFDAVTLAIRALRGPGYGIGGRLLNLCRGLGLVGVACTAATHVWTEWDPDVEAAPSGFFPIRAAVVQLVDLGLLNRDIAHRFVAGIEDAARQGRFCMSLTMFAVFGRTPARLG